MNNPCHWLAVILATAALPLAAQEVLRCQGPDGRVSYAQGVCPSGTTAVRTLPPPETPSASDQTAAQQRAQQDMRNAAALDRARKADEERAAREQQKALAEAKKQEAQCRRLETRWRQAQDDLAQATPSRRAEMQRRVDRAEALHAADCGPTTK